MSTDMKVIRRYLLFILAVGLLAVVVLNRQQLPYSGGSLAPALAPQMLLTMDSAYLVGSGASGKIWSLKAERVEMTQDRSNTIITRIRNASIYEKGKPLLHIDAGRALYNQYSQDLRIAGGIKLRGEAGQNADCSGAVWDPRKNTLTTSGKVSYVDPSMRATAEGLSVNTSSKELILTKPRLEVDLKEVAGGRAIGL